MSRDVTTLGELISLQRGYDLPETQRRPGKVPVVGSAGITGYHDTAKIKGPGVTVGRSGASFGKVNFVREDYWPHNAALFVTDFKGNEPLFIRYLLESLDFSSLNSGSAQQSLNRNYVYGVSVRKFDLSVQRRIANILSAYDDLIENNQRRIKILEDMARSLYREWFVHFRFPGHDKVKMVPSPLGPIPQGWEVRTIADLCELVSYGYTASAVREEIGPKFLRITDIVPDVIEWERVPFCEIPTGKAPKYLVKQGDIVIARTGATTGYAKRLNKRHPETVFASYLVRVRAHADVSNLMLGLLVESADYKQFIKTNIGGAAQPQANAVVLTSMRLAAPPSPLCKKFDHLVEPLFDEAELLAIKMQNLRRTRNLLLPRLLSGQINVNPTESVA